MIALLRFRVALAVCVADVGDGLGAAWRGGDGLGAGRLGADGSPGRRLRSERGEGVISAAIAVLIIAMLGAAMWVVFSGMMEGATGRIETSVESIG